MLGCLDPAAGPGLVLQTEPVTSSLPGLEALQPGMVGWETELWLWNNSQLWEGIQPPFGENPQLSLESTALCSGLHRVLVLVSCPCTASNPHGTRIQRNARAAAAAELFSSQGAAQVPLFPPLLSPRHRAAQEPCHAILLCPDGPRDSCLLECLPSSGQSLLYRCGFLVFL